MRLILALVAVALAGCTDLPNLHDNECANGTLDPGEACDEPNDGPNARCVSCQIVCGGLQPGETCAPGFVCGLDGTCRAPAGVFGEISDELPLAPIDVTITDVDGDDIKDVLALTGTSISVTFGDPSGFLPRQARSFVPPFRGAPAFGNLDDDGHTDVLLSTTDGIVGFSSAHRVIAPHPFAIDLGTTTPVSCLSGQPFGVFAISPQYLGVLIDVMGRIDLAVIDSAGKDACPIQQVPLCTVSAAVDPRTFTSDVYDISDGTSESHVLALATPIGACVATITKPAAAPAPFSLSPQVIASFPQKKRPVLAQLETSGCPSLLYSASSTVLKEYAATGSPPACGVATTTTDVTLGAASIPPGAVAIGHVRLQPPIAGAARDAIALSTGLYAIADSHANATELYRSDRPLAVVQTTDLDGDGDLDVAAIGGDPLGGSGADGIDALYRTGMTDRFLRVRTATRGPVTQLAVGDFDGNEVGDIAYTEAVVDGVRLDVLYGTRDRLLDPLEVGAFSQVVGLCPMQATDSADPGKLIADLTIIDLPTFGKPPLFTLLHGSPQRTMLSFYDPRVRVFGVTPSTAFTGVSFANLDRTSARIDDVLAVETGPVDTKIWPATNTASGLTFPSATRVDSGIHDNTRFVAWPLADRDVMIGISYSFPPRTVILDPAAFSGTYTPLTSNQLDGTEGLQVNNAYVASFEDPRVHTLVVTFQGSLGFEPMVVLCSADDRGVPTDCADVTRATGMAEGTLCVDAALANVAPRTINDPSTGQQLVMLCHVGSRYDLWAVRQREGNLSAELLTITDEVTRGRLDKVVALRAGDVTGDGVDDVLALTSGAGEGARTVLVIPQCASTDLVCQGIGGTSP